MNKDHPHGSLREALISASLELLQDGGIAGLTLRRAAARAGVSHAAPAHHFDGLPGLLTATAARAFALFTQHMETARDASAPTDRARLQGVCDGYIAFARAHAGLFQLMFFTNGLCHDDADFLTQSSAAYDVLRRACAPFAGAQPQVMELAVWSLVHGFASLTQGPTITPQGQIPTHAFGAMLAQLIAE